MRTITATELRQKLGEILDAASAGESILIERDHKPLAFVVSYEDGVRVTSGKDEEEEVARRLRALEELTEFAKEWRRERGDTDDGMRAAEWVRYDRDHRDDDK
jgi:prevent-host-death family protein